MRIIINSAADFFFLDKRETPSSHDFYEFTYFLYIAVETDLISH